MNAEAYHTPFGKECTTSEHFVGVFIYIYIWVNIDDEDDDVEVWICLH